MKVRDRVVELRRVKASELVPNPKNWRTHPVGQADALKELLADVGYADALLARETPDGLMLIDGHLRAETTPDSEVPVLVLDVTQDEADKILLTLDPLASLAGVDAESLGELLDSVKLESADLLDLLNDKMPVKAPVTHTDPDAAPPVPEKPLTKTGDLWLLGDHRVLCGDATRRQDVEVLLGPDRKTDLLLTDPPYCSGGFQEAGRAAGSIGSDAKLKRTIANDTLSTRGYIALMRQVLGGADIGLAHIFTDWRMWVNLFDVVESSGFGVRSMIVWNKGTPGMGRGWRSQHELIMYASRATVVFDNHKANGNVVSLSRTGNPLHPTQKPVELLETVLDVCDMAQSVYDPFIGSGSTLIACHKAGRRCHGLELDPRYVDVICRRYQEHTLDLPRRADTGEAVDFTDGQA